MSRHLLRTTGATIQQWADAVRYARELRRPSLSVVAEGRRMLFVTRALPPRFHGGAFRQVSLLRALTRAGWAIDAITDAPPPTPSAAGQALERRLPEEVRIHRWPAPAPASWKLAPRLSGGFGSIRRIIEAAGRLDGTPSIVVASGPPFAEFVAAVVLSKGYRVPCVLDYRDEWTTSDFAFVDKNRNDSRWEQRCLAGATVTVFATEAMREHYLATYPVLRGRATATIRNGWDDTGAFGPVGPRAVTDPARPAVIGFFGFLGEHWDFDGFTRTMARALEAEPDLADRTRFAVYGNVSPGNVAAIEALERPSLFTLHGLVPQDEAQRRMTSCDALILFNSDRLARVLPGKIFEYLASRRPILLYGDAGEMSAVLAGAPGAQIVPRGDAAALAAALQRIRSGAAASEIAAAPQDYADAFRRSHREREWIELLDRLKRRPPAGQ